MKTQISHSLLSFGASSSWTVNENYAFLCSVLFFPACGVKMNDTQIECGKVEFAHYSNALIFN